MKTIIMNGCSFVAGDELVWQQYHTEYNKPVTNWWTMTNDPEYELFREVYREKYRRQYNLPILIAQKLECNRLDLSADGNSNDGIVMDTIAFILTIPPEKRCNYHVVIGWTTLCRYLRYSKIKDNFFNLNVGYLQGKNSNDVIDELEGFIKGAMVNGYNQDFFFNFVQNIMLLENFLKVNNMTYTFYKSLGTPEDMKYCVLGEFSEHRTIPKELVTDHSCWLKFSDSEDSLDHTYLPYMGHSWNSAILKQNSNMFISKENCHPNIETVTNVSHLIADFIKQQNVL